LLAKGNRFSPYPGGDDIAIIKVEPSLLQSLFHRGSGAYFCLITRRDNTGNENAIIILDNRFSGQAADIYA
jgi:hypothetical protein